MRRTGKLFGIAAIVFAMTTLLFTEAWAEKKIGILIWSEEARYSDAVKGVVEQLKKDGFGEHNVKFIIEKAGGSKIKAAESARKLADAKVDMVIPIGTSAAVAAAKEIKEVPIVFSMVYDPVEAKIAKDWKNSGNNTTGASPRVPMSKLLDTLKQIAPVKKLAVLYTPGEKNSEIQLRELEGEQGTSQIKIVPVPLSRKDSVPQIMSEVVGAADAVYLSGSSIIGETVSTIVDITAKAKVITVTHLDDLMDKGVLLGVCADPHAVGLLTGAKAAKVLKGAKPSSIPIEPLKKLDIIVNMKTAKASQVQVPPAFMKTVTKTIK